MPQLNAFRPSAVAGSRQTGPALIGAGISILLLASWLPMMPVAIAMALVALGATITIITRFKSASAIWPIIAMNLVVYSGLYALLLGAVFHAAKTGPQTELTILQWLDIGAGSMLMTMVMRICVAAMTGDDDAPAR